MNTKTNGEGDEDSAFLERVLDKLYDFGNGPASNKKKSQKKKKRKRCQEEEEDSPAVEDSYNDADNPVNHIGSENQQQQTNTEQAGQTSPQVEVVTFQDPRKKQKTKQMPAPEKRPVLQMMETSESSQPEELSLEKARLEVHRFGITGYKKEQQRVFEQDRAIMLGARPPKKEYVNYKLLQQQIKEKKEKAKTEVNPDLKKKKKKKSNQGDKIKVSSGPGMAPTGQVGRFKNGMLILSSKEIQKIKGNKKRR
ncbi:40S small subunit processome assembly factor 1 [Halichoeres trimaculatus]|uniref:40S small subunit processome assembly factor 1 n=1 Tax=Halichoeres trimaculatus TaxID=147232 RepID=UPI003D9F6BF0